MNEAFSKYRELQQADHAENKVLGEAMSHEKKLKAVMGKGSQPKSKEFPGGDKHTPHTELARHLSSSAEKASELAHTHGAKHPELHKTAADLHHMAHEHHPDAAGSAKNPEVAAWHKHTAEVHRYHDRMHSAEHGIRTGQYGFKG